MIAYKDWRNIPWDKVQLFIYDLQNKIYRQAKNNEIGLVRHYQNKLVKSMEAKLLAVRSVSQDNRGKVTAGVDKIAKLNPEQRLKLARKLVLDSEGKRTGDIRFIHGHCHDQIHSTKSKNF